MQSRLWPVATFDQIFVEHVRSNYSEELSDNIDKLFRNEPPRRAYRTIRILTVHKDTETATVCVARLSALMATVVVSLSTNMSIGAGTDSAATIYTDHITGRMTGKKGTTSKSDPRIRSRAARKPNEDCGSFKAYLLEALFRC